LTGQDRQLDALQVQPDPMLRCVAGCCTAGR
jgi:hypothetical protein